MSELTDQITQRLETLATKVESQRSTIETEEATKNAFVMPFIALVLGYDVFNPNEVVPEYTADVGTKKGEKIDYAIVQDGVLQMLIECKKIGEPLNINHASQLFRYFATENARIGVLTNGDEYQFFTDLEKTNRMDEKPFLVLTVTDLDTALIPEICKLTKEIFDLDSILNAAEELKYVGELKRVLAAEFKAPQDDWVKFLASRVYDRPYTQKTREQFSSLVPKAMKQFLADQVNDRLKAALGGQQTDPTTGLTNDSADSPTDETHTSSSQSDDGIETTASELAAYNIVRAIVCSEVPMDRIYARDTKSYFGILLDDNNRKPIARLHFNAGTKYLGLLDADKNETRVPLDLLEDIYKYSDQLRQAVHNYL